ETTAPFAEQLCRCSESTRSTANQGEAGQAERRDAIFYLAAPGVHRRADGEVARGAPEGIAGRDATAGQTFGLPWRGGNAVKIKRVFIKNFKRFSDLTIEGIPESRTPDIELCENVRFFDQDSRIA